MTNDAHKTTDPSWEELGPDPSQRDEPETDQERPDFEGFFAAHPPLPGGDEAMRILLEDREEDLGEPPF